MKQSRNHKNKQISPVRQRLQDLYRRLLFVGGIGALLLIMTGADQEISALEIPAPVVATCEKDAPKALHCEMDLQRHDRSLFKFGKTRT